MFKDTFRVSVLFDTAVHSKWLHWKLKLKPQRCRFIKLRRSFDTSACQYWCQRSTLPLLNTMIVLIDTKAVSRKVSADILAISANVTDTLKEYNWYVPLCQRHSLTPWWCLQSCAHARQIRGDSFYYVSCRRYMSCEYIGIFYTLFFSFR